MIQFKDSKAQLGRPFRAPDSELTVSIQPQSRSLSELSKFDAESKRIECSIKDGKLRLDLSHVIGDRIIIKRDDAVRLAYWLLGYLEVKGDRRRKKENLDR